MKSFFMSMRIILGWLFCMAQVSAQSYYPGGLGNTNIVIWLNANKAGSITQNGSNQVSQWADLSGNGYSFVQATTTQEPVYGAVSGPYNRPALTFISTSSQYLSTPGLPASISFTTGASSFAVGSFNAPQTGQGWQRIFDLGDGTASNNIAFGRYGATANLYYEGWKGGTGDQTYTTTSPIVNGFDTLYEAVQQGGAAGTLSAVSHYASGTSQADNGGAGSSKTWVPPSIARTANYIGRSNWAADNYFSGTLSEILLYNTAFNATQRIIIENYLSAEWGEAISTVKYIPPTSTTYTTNLVGIGYTSAADNFLVNPAGSTDGLGFSSTTGATGFLNTTGYLTAAHNGQANTVISNATVPGITSAGSLSRWNRSWDVQKTGGNATGLVTLNFNFSDYNGTVPNGTLVYSLLYNATDGSFATGTNALVTTSSTSVSGNIVSFVVNAANLANGYYSIIYSSSPIILPVILTEFVATKQGDNSLLQWSTSLEEGSARFDIERATASAGFTTIGTIAAQDNSLTPAIYSFMDSNPEAGPNDYRLKMVDQDGNASYSAIRSVDFGTGTPVVIRVYPSPMADELHISISNNFTGTARILVVDLQGQVLRVMRSASSNTVIIPVNGLAAGIYFIEVNTDTIRYIQKVLKN